MATANTKRITRIADLIRFKGIYLYSLTAIESLRATIENQEGKQDEKIEVLQEYH